MANPVYVEDVIEDFFSYMKKKCYDRKYFENMKIFWGYLNYEPKLYNLVLKKQCKELKEQAKELVRANKKEYPELKATKVERGKFFNSFVDYFNSYEYKGGRKKLEKIPFVMNDLERKLDLMKHYREYYIIKKLSAKEVADIYYVDEKTIRNDKKEIKDGNLNAFGQKINIGYDDETKSFFSTPVPIFTVQNITQIVTILNGLGVMYKDEIYSEYALRTALTIWNQLTLSVKNRIQNELVDIMGLDAEWYNKLSGYTDVYFKGFYSERDMSSVSKGNILMYLKNGMPVDIYYASGDEIHHLSGVRLSNYIDKQLTVRDGEESIIISLEDIIKIKENGN